MVMLLVALDGILFPRWAFKRVTRTDTFRQKPLLGLWPAISPSLFPRNRLRLLTNEASVGYVAFCNCYTLYALSSIYGFHRSLGSTWSLVFIHIMCSRRSGLLSAGFICSVGIARSRHIRRHIPSSVTFLIVTIKRKWCNNPIYKFINSWMISTEPFQLASYCNCTKKRAHNTEGSLTKEAWMHF